MDDLFNMLSSSARIDKSKRKKKPKKQPSAIQAMKQIKASQDYDDNGDSVHSDDNDDASIDSDNNNSSNVEPKKKRPKKQHSAKKLAQIHREEIAAFRRRMGIKLSNDNKHEVALGSIPDPISSFDDWKCPTWWSTNNTGTTTERNSKSIPKNNDNNNNNNESSKLFHGIHRNILHNIEKGQWPEPTPIQMQAVPSLMERRDVMGCAPTGSGKSGAFVLPAIMLAKCSEEIYYGQNGFVSGGAKQKDANTEEQDGKNKKNKKKKAKEPQADLKGHVRTILLAPSRELASQLHREVLRLSQGMPGKFHCVLLSKSNAGLASSNQLGGKHGLDCLVATPLRLVESLERGMKLNGVRLVVLDEADRLLDANDGSIGKKKENKNDSDDDDDDDEINPKQQQQSSGSSQSRTFLQQIDSILTELPPSASRALFSATLGPSVRHLSESILRSPIDVRTGSHAGAGGDSAASGVANTIQQELKFVGREEGKLLAIRQLVTDGLTPPVLIFLQSQERAQALFGELLYDGIRVDVLHAGRSPAQREASVSKFRRGETWVLICTDLVARGVDFKGVNLVINYDLPREGVTYVHRIGRTGRAGREGRAVTFFTEGDFDELRTIANVMRLSGCDVPEWMLTMKKQRSRNDRPPPKRGDIDTTPRGDRKRRRNKSRRTKK